MPVTTFSLGNYFPIYHKQKNKDGRLIGFYSADNKWEYKISQYNPQLLNNVLSDLFSFLDDKRIQSKIKDKDIQLDNDTRDDIFNSIRQIIYFTTEKRVDDYTKIPGYKTKTIDLIKTCLINSKKRKKYIDKIVKFASDYKSINFDQLPSKTTSSMHNPYRLHGNFKYDPKMQEKLTAFSRECNSIMCDNTYELNNIKLFFSGSDAFQKLKFNISMVCIKHFFEKIHDLIERNKTDVICISGKRLPSNFLCQSCEMLITKKTITKYHLIKHSTFKTAASNKCKLPNVHSNIDIAVNCLL
jgi:hypothetical protein